MDNEKSIPFIIKTTLLYGCLAKMLLAWVVLTIAVIIQVCWVQKPLNRLQNQGEIAQAVLLSKDLLRKKPEISYSYIVNDKTYIGRTYYKKRRYSKEERKSLYNKLNQTDTIQIYYNPLKPEQSIYMLTADTVPVYNDLFLTIIAGWVFFILMFLKILRDAVGWRKSGDGKRNG